MRQGTTDQEGPTVWAAEHGASNPDLGRGEDASNVGHRWRIHGRLEDLHNEEASPKAGAGSDTRSFASETAARSGTPLDVEQLRSLVARDTEIDMRDVQIELSRGEVTLRGTVVDEGERLALVELVSQQPGVAAVQNRLLVQVD